MKVVAAVAVALTVACATRAASAQAADDAPRPPPAVAELLEDNADTLLPQLTNPTGDPGEGHVETADVFAGKSAVRIVPLQRFQPHIPGWNYRIAENPRPGEYRYVRWAWKADGCAGTMVQFHIETGWSVRYCAGNNDPGWGTKYVAPEPPAGWVVVTRDLFADFGECTVTGIAMAAFRGRGARFDHVYLGRTVDDLDRVDATGLRNRPAPRLAAADLDRLWADLGGADAPKAYLAFWTLASAPDQAVPFLARALGAAAAPEDAAKFGRWVSELDAPDFRTRENAAARLAEHAEACEGLLARSLPGAGPEARSRIEQLLAAAASRPESSRAEKAVRLLTYADTPASRAALAELARGDGSAAARAAAVLRGPPPAAPGDNPAGQ